MNTTQLLAEFRERFPDLGLLIQNGESNPICAGDVEGLESFILHAYAEGKAAGIAEEAVGCVDHCKAEYERGRAEGEKNPKVGFLRQYLNESPDWNGTPWDDEALLTFLRIPFVEAAKNNPDV